MVKVPQTWQKTLYIGTAAYESPKTPNTTPRRYSPNVLFRCCCRFADIILEDDSPRLLGQYKGFNLADQAAKGVNLADQAALNGTKALDLSCREE